MTKEKSGCYVTKPMVLPNKKLNCSDSKELRTICNCPDAVNKLKKLCSDIDEEQTCAEGYIYSYVKYTWIDGLYDSVNALLKAAEDAENQAWKILTFLTKYGLYIVLGLVLLFLLPKIIKIINASIKKNG